MRSDRKLGMGMAGTRMTKSRLLLIEPAPSVRRLFARTFEDLGFDVATAASRSEGIRMVAAESFDMVIVEAPFSPGQQEEIELGLLGVAPERVPIILEYEPLHVGGESRAEGSSTLSIHRRETLTPLVTQIRDLLSHEPSVAA